MADDTENTYKKSETQPAAKTPESTAPQVNEGVQKFQSYYKALTNSARVDVDGKPREIEVDGREGPVTRAALAKFKKDNNMPEDAGIDAVNAKMEEQIKKDPAAVARFSQDTMADGNNSSPGNITALQLILNLLSALFGGKQLNVDGKIGEQTMGVYSDVNERTNGALAGGLPGRGGPAQSRAAGDTIIQPGQVHNETRIAPGGETPGISGAAAADPRSVQTITVDPSLAQPSPSQDFNLAANQPRSGGPTQMLESPAPQPSQPIVFENPPIPGGPQMEAPQLGQQNVVTPPFNAASSNVAPPEHYSRQQDMQVAQARPHEEYMRGMSRDDSRDIQNNGRATRDAVRTRETVDTSDGRVNATNARSGAAVQQQAQRTVNGWLGVIQRADRTIGRLGR